MKHLNDNVYCVVSLETSGPIPGVHDILEICVLPLDGYRQAKILPFTAVIKPKRPQNYNPKRRTQNAQLHELMQYATDPWTAANAFDSWFSRLNLLVNKRIIPICYNSRLILPFVAEWLGYDEDDNTSYYDLYFHDHLAIDVLALPMYWNDVAYLNAQLYPFTRQTERNVVLKMDVEHFQKRGPALSRATSLAQAYRKFLDIKIPYGIQLPLRQIMPIDYSEHEEEDNEE